MEFMFLMIDREAVDLWTQEQRRIAIARMRAFQEQLIASGRYNGGGGVGPLYDVSLARISNKTVMVENRTVDDEAQIIGGFMVVKCDSLAEAIELGKTCPASEWAKVEVRSLSWQ